MYPVILEGMTRSGKILNFDTDMSSPPPGSVSSSDAGKVLHENSNICKSMQY